MDSIKLIFINKPSVLRTMLKINMNLDEIYVLSRDPLVHEISRTKKIKYLNYNNLLDDKDVENSHDKWYDIFTKLSEFDKGMVFFSVPIFKILRTNVFSKWFFYHFFNSKSVIKKNFKRYYIEKFFIIDTGE